MIDHEEAATLGIAGAAGAFYHLLTGRRRSLWRWLVRLALSIVAAVFIGPTMCVVAKHLLLAVVRVPETDLARFDTSLPLLVGFLIGHGSDKLLQVVQRRFLGEAGGDSKKKKKDQESDEDDDEPLDTP